MLQLTIIHLSETFENMALQLKYRIFFTVENIWFYIFHFLQLFFLRDKYMFKETAVKKKMDRVLAGEGTFELRSLGLHQAPWGELMEKKDLPAMLQ